MDDTLAEVVYIHFKLLKIIYEWQQSGKLSLGWISLLFSTRPPYLLRP